MREVSERTRTRIIASLRAGEKTVRELKEEMELTGNAIRLHLENLEREGLVSISGTRAGSRKPHNVYKLTPHARKAHFEGCEPLLSDLLAAISTCLSPFKVREIVTDTAHRMATKHPPSGHGKGGNKHDRLENSLALLRKLGGSPRLEREDGILRIESASCPWAAVSGRHPEVCLIAEKLLSELLGTEVRQRCFRGEYPRCSFTLSQTSP
jgi:predicted ArsR family transcriptional regulator